MIRIKDQQLNVRCILFDMDGTLVDSTSVVPDAFIAAIAALGGRTLQRQDVIAEYASGPPRTILGRLLGRPAMDMELDLYHRNLLERSGHIQPYDGIAELLERLSPAYAIGVFTGATRRAAEIVLEAADLRRWFSVIVGGDEIQNPKPAPDGIHRAAALLQVNPEEMAYIGDAVIDLRAAKNAGALAVAAAWGHQYDANCPADFTLHTPDDMHVLASSAIGSS